MRWVVKNEIQLNKHKLICRDVLKGRLYLYMYSYRWQLIVLKYEHAKKDSGSIKARKQHFR